MGCWSIPGFLPSCCCRYPLTPGWREAIEVKQLAQDCKQTMPVTRICPQTPWSRETKNDWYKTIHISCYDENTFWLPYCRIAIPGIPLQSCQWCVVSTTVIGYASSIVQLILNIIFMHRLENHWDSQLVQARGVKWTNTRIISSCNEKSGTLSSRRQGLCNMSGVFLNPFIFDTWNPVTGSSYPTMLILWIRLTLRPIALLRCALMHCTFL